MARLLLLTNALAPSAEVLPALGLLSHTVRILPAEATALVDSPDCDVVVVDARRELASARSLCRVLRTTGIGTPLLAVLTEGGLAGLTSEWGLDDVLLDTAGPAEVDARLRLRHDQGTGRRRRPRPADHLGRARHRRGVLLREASGATRST